MKHLLLITALYGLTVANARTRFSEPSNIMPRAPSGAEIPLNLIGMDKSSKTDFPGEPLTPQDFKNAKNADMVKNQELSAGVDPTMIAGKFQGDIILPTPEIVQELSANIASDEPQRNAIVADSKKWINGVIPYVISAQYTLNERATIAKGLAVFHDTTCLRFTPRVSSDPDYIFITKGSGCSSAVGRVGGEQQVSLGDGCIYYGTVIHELMHATGFWHEQSRSDRDDHVTIVTSNIIPGMEYNFEKYSWDIIQSLGVSYDTGSIMHYGPTAFAVDRKKPTIISKSGSVIGQRNALSKKDTTKLNALYQCAGEGTSQVTSSPVVTTAAPPAGDCTDGNVHCDFWATAGECTKNPSWMNANCKKSCKQCGKCQDDNIHCDAWSGSGECRNSPAYMHTHCKKACGLCHSGAEQSGTTCIDENKFCPSWATSGECRVNPAYMMKRCAKSCNACN